MTDDPYHRPSFSLGNRLTRGAWELVRVVLFRLSPRPMHPWRSFVLRCFGAKLGRRCHIYPAARIWAPWNLHCEDSVTIADEAVVYNPAAVYLGSHAIVSQQAYLCGATHDYDSPGFELQARPIHIERYAWICARATVHAGLTVHEGSILGLGAVATRDLSPWCVYAGVPARQVKMRRNWIDGSGARGPGAVFVAGSAPPADANAPGE